VHSVCASVLPLAHEVGNSVWELLAILVVVAIPLAPLSWVAWSFFGADRGEEIDSGRSAATPFVAIAVVGAAIAAAAFLALLLVVLLRAAAG
jgi:hypothetical protein